MTPPMDTEWTRAYPQISMNVSITGTIMAAYLEYIKQEFPKIDDELYQYVGGKLYYLYYQLKGVI